MELRFEPKFYREHLGEKSDHKSLIQDFQPTRPEGYGLTRYLQDQAFVDEETKSDCDEVTHAPDAEDLFTCSKCGAEVPAKYAYSE
jgi:hypothetical protein